MEQNNNAGWYVLDGIALLCLIGYSIGKPGNSGVTALPPVDSSAAPDTAGNTEIIITSGKQFFYGTPYTILPFYQCSQSVFTR